MSIRMNLCMNDYDPISTVSVCINGKVHFFRFIDQLYNHAKDFNHDKYKVHYRLEKIIHLTIQYISETYQLYVLILLVHATWSSSGLPSPLVDTPLLPREIPFPLL